MHSGTWTAPTNRRLPWYVYGMYVRCEDSDSVSNFNVNSFHRWKLGRTNDFRGSKLKRAVCANKSICILYVCYEQQSLPLELVRVLWDCNLQHAAGWVEAVHG